MGTKYDCRNDSAWHVKNRQTFTLGPIVTNGLEKREVRTLEDLQLSDKDGNLVTQDRLLHHMSYLNGEKTIGGFSSMTTMSRINQGQKTISKTKETRGLKASENELRERRKVMDTLDKQMLQVRKIQ